MDDSSVTDVDRSIPNALFTSVLGLKGPLRIAPHGSEHKPHIILKRVDPPSNLESNGESSRVARFSFFAHKRFEVKPGKEIMFAVASADGNEGPFKEIALVLEADLDATLDTTTEEEANHSPVKKVDTKEFGNVQGLPPKMRKSYTKEKTYASYISKEPSSSLGFLGYPMNIVPNRVFSSASVQTDSSPPPTNLEVTLVDVTSQLASMHHSNKSPVQLPSPVSADHGREPHSDNLAQPEEEDMDDISRIERSLSPMDLGSPSCSESPVNSPLPLLSRNPTPEPSITCQLPEKSPVSTSFSPKPNGVVSRFATSAANSSEVNLVTTSSKVFENFCEPPKPSYNLPSDEGSSSVTPHKPPSAILEAATPIAISPKTSTSKPFTTSTKTFEDSQPLRDTPKASDSTLDEVSSAITPRESLPRVMKGATRSITLSDLFVKATSSVSGFSHTDTQAAVESPEVGNKILNGIVAPQRQSPSPTDNAFASSSKVPLDNLRKVQTSATLPHPPPRVAIPNPSPPPDPKEVVYIPAGSAGNPLGIRPSSNPAMTMTPNQRPLPSGPRSLRTATVVMAAKKPVVVGANWSAARSSGSASTSASNSVPVTPSSSSSSLTSSAASRPIPKATDLSRILSYGSPSPPPPPDSDPPPAPPPQCQSGVSKWKRITGDDEKASASSNSVNSKTLKTPPTPIDQPSTKIGQVDATSSASLTKPPKKQTAPLSSPNPSDDKQNVVQADASSAGSIVKSPAKRPLPPSTPNSSSDDTKQGDVVTESPSKKAKIAESATSSMSKNSAAAKVPPEAASTPKASTSKPPQPLTHPLPPKPLPVHIGSSYRPSLKRERSRSPDVPVSKRPATSTDWPATYCSVERRLQVHDNSDVGVQKVVFNHDGTQFALICECWEDIFD
ncbi:hypothetical protein BYT27DRAFT_7336859 [Phlegmacium glaucopus]|nr:hypothetical protein BYT27DRAFT_7336859 [Phlegmacium glaucopus]